MKNIFFGVLLACVVNFSAFAGTCPPGVDAATTCPNFTGGTAALSLTPQYQTYSGSTIIWTSEADMITAGFTDCIFMNEPYERCIQMSLINIAKSLQSQINTLGGSKTFSYPSRALNSCFQISSTKDAWFRYAVDVTTGLSLTTGAQGTVTITSYTNSGCTTGSQVIADGTSSQTGTLVVGLALNQIASLPVSGAVPANRWLKITTANTVGTPTFSIRAVQQEVLF